MTIQTVLMLKNTVKTNNPPQWLSSKSPVMAQ